MVFGWDISTSIVGTCVLDNSGSFVAARYLDLRKVEGGLLRKADLADEYVSWIVKEFEQFVHGPTTHFVEEKLGGFSMGHSMMQTLMTLASFNLVVSWCIWRTLCCDECHLHHIHPSTTKSLMRKAGLIIQKGEDKKRLTLGFVSGREPSFPLELNRNGNPQPYCFDMADAYIVARSGLMKFGADV